MDRHQLLTLLIQQARKNGFEFRKWYRSHTMRPWVSPEDAVLWLEQGARAQMLLFSHPFARSFFGNGERLRYIQPAVTYQRILQDGSSRFVHRRAHTRQSSRDGVWLYHLREMAAEREPLRYLRRYLILEETMHEARSQAPVTLAEGALSTRLDDYDEELIVRH